jgi:superfamily II DNA or RNA helicase
VLLVMATGTGKTYTAFQIIWRLWKSGAKKRILFLADRNILIDQTMVNDFRPFKGAMAKLSPNAKGVERIDAQGKTTVEDVDLAVNKPPSRSTRATRSTCRSTRPSPAPKKNATSTSSSRPTSST